MRLFAVAVIIILVVSGCFDTGRAGETTSPLLTEPTEVVPSTALQPRTGCVADGRCTAPEDDETCPLDCGDNPAPCTSSGGVTICVSEALPRNVSIRINVSGTVAVAPYDSCLDEPTLEKWHSSGWEPLNVYATYGKGCGHFIGSPMPSKEDISGYCWADWCPTETNITQAEFNLDWDGREYLKPKPHLREDPPPVLSENGLYRVSFHGYHKEFILGGCAGEGGQIHPYDGVKSPPEIAADGNYAYAWTDTPRFCCPGLSPLGLWEMNSSGKCEQLVGSPYQTCAPCGDGACDGRYLENGCSCLQDCGT